jgi:hypothetical protein
MSQNVAADFAALSVIGRQALPLVSGLPDAKRCAEIAFAPTSATNAIAVLTPRDPRNPISIIASPITGPEWVSARIL